MYNFNPFGGWAASHEVPGFAPPLHNGFAFLGEESWPLKSALVPPCAYRHAGTGVKESGSSHLQVDAEGDEQPPNGPQHQ